MKREFKVVYTPIEDGWVMAQVPERKVVRVPADGFFVRRTHYGRNAMLAGAVVAAGAMEWALVTHDFSLAYVVRNHARSTPLLTSTAHGRMPRTTSPTVSGVNPPAAMIGGSPSNRPSSMKRFTVAQSLATPVPPGAAVPADWAAAKASLIARWACSCRPSSDADWFTTMFSCGGIVNQMWTSNPVPCRYACTLPAGR